MDRPASRSVHPRSAVGVPSQRSGVRRDGGTCPDRSLVDGHVWAPFRPDRGTNPPRDEPSMGGGAGTMSVERSWPDDREKGGTRVGPATLRVQGLRGEELANGSARARAASRQPPPNLPRPIAEALSDELPANGQVLAKSLPEVSPERDRAAEGRLARSSRRSHRSGLWMPQHGGPRSRFVAVNATAARRPAAASRATMCPALANARR